MHTSSTLITYVSAFILTLRVVIASLELVLQLTAPALKRQRM